MRILNRFICALAILAVAGCSSDTSDTAKTDTESASQVAQSEATAAVTTLPGLITNPSGVRYQVMLDGNGAEVIDGMYVEYDYSVWFADSIGLTKAASLGSSVGRPGAAFKAQVGVHGLAGLNDGVLGMKLGGSRRIFIPWELGYGEEGPPPKTNLIFEVENIKEVPQDVVDKYQEEERKRREYYKRRQDSLDQL